MSRIMKIGLTALVAVGVAAGLWKLGIIGPRPSFESEMVRNTLTSTAVPLVQKSMKIDGEQLSYREGRAFGGIAVLVGEAGYWVRDGKVYAANDFAKQLSPTIDYAPAPVAYATIRDSVR